MSNDLETPPAPGAMRLVSGIIADVQLLIAQQLALFRHEIRGEFVRAREAGAIVAGGLATALTGGLLLCGMLVHLLAWLAPACPLWGCYGIVGAPIVALGTVVCFVGMRKFRRFNAVTAEIDRNLKETVGG